MLFNRQHKKNDTQRKQLFIPHVIEKYLLTCHHDKYKLDLQTF